MTMQDLIRKIAETTKLQQKEIDNVLAALGDEVQAALVAGDEVKLPGIGKFSVGERAAKTGRNPQTGETIQIAAKRVPKFTPGKALKDAVAG